MLDSPGKEISLNFNIFELSGLEKLRVDVQKAIDNDTIVNNEFQYESYWGKEMWAEYHINPLSCKGFKEVIISFNDITDKKKAEQELYYLSFHDQLTELYNRRYFENELKRLKDSRKLPISIIVADLDNLKQINDNFGHQKGDEYIKMAGEILKNITRSEDIAARMGGDEFGIILTYTDFESAKKIADRIINKCREYNENFELVPPLNISVGFSTKEKKDIELDDIYNQADNNMYLMKKNKN